ncbi:phage major tail protein, TP901-1 family [bacterium AH-315-P15]|nr:phage major tail protein, TP901-1 family [bacterium AH-315-P15]
MAAQKGKDVLLKLGNGDGPPETFSTVGGLRTTALNFNSQSVDVTDAASSGQWRELLAGAGIKTASISGSGVFKDAASDANVRQAFFDQTHDNWQLVIPDFGTVEGAFQIRELQYSGAHDGEATFTLALESAGALTFTVI